MNIREEKIMGKGCGKKVAICGAAAQLKPLMMGLKLVRYKRICEVL